MKNNPLRDGPLFFIGGGGVPFLGLADKFVLKSNVFQTIFSLHFVQPFLINITGFL